MRCAGSAVQDAVQTEVSALRALLLDKEGELNVLHEDNSAKERELLHVLDLLRDAHSREDELRREVCSLSGQLDILHDALHHGDGDLNSMDGSARLGEGTHVAQLEADWAMSENRLLEQLAQAKEDVETSRERIALLEAALMAAEGRAAHLQGQVGHLQVCLNTLKGEDAGLEDEMPLREGGKGRGEKLALRMAGIVLAARLFVHTAWSLSGGLNR